MRKLTMLIPRVLAASLAIGLGACGGASSEPGTPAPPVGGPQPPGSNPPAGSPPDGGTVPTPPTGNDPLAGDPVLKRGCNWILAFDPNVPGLGNTAFPDTSVRYWVAYIAADVPAGSVLRIEGRYPAARYSSLKVHDGNLLVLDGLTDYQLAPDAGQSTPFLDITTLVPGLAFGGGYTALLKIGHDVPTPRQRNTLYRKPPAATDGVRRRTTVLAYRTYLPESDNTGQVGLPRLTLQTPAGNGPLANAEDAASCAAIGSLYYQDGARLPGLTNAFDPIPALPNPVFKIFNSAALQTTNTGVGLNTDNGFAYIKTDRNLGELLLVRGLPPSHTAEVGAGNPPQVRYWSLCQYGFNTQKVYDCVPDRSAPRDSTGRYTLVVASDSTRPALATAQLGFSYLPFGPERQGVLTMRELLPHPTFAEAIVRSPAVNDNGAQRGVYQPQATYCARAVFDAAAPQGAAAAFAACVESRRLLPASG